jgi:hypothetical protein
LEHDFIAQRVCSVNHRSNPRGPVPTDKSGRKAAFALTKEAFEMLVLLSSLSLWAALWAAAASLASAWLQ